MPIIRDKTHSESVLKYKESEEIAEIPERIAEEVIIDGDNKLEEEKGSININGDFEDIRGLDIETKSVIIVDEFENNTPQSERIEAENNEMIDIEKLATEIDSLIYIKKDIIMENSQQPPTIDVDSHETNEYSHHIDDLNLELLTEEITEIIEDNDEYRENNEAIALSSEEQKIITDPAEPITKITEEIEKIAQPAMETEDPVSSDEIHDQDVKKVIEKGPTKEDEKYILDTENVNTITIEIPNEIREKLPNNFKIDGLGKVDLKEAEKIANEDLLSLTKDDLIKELEELHIIPIGKDKKGGIEKNGSANNKFEESLTEVNGSSQIDESEVKDKKTEEPIKQHSKKSPEEIQGNMTAEDETLKEEALEDSSTDKGIERSELEDYHPDKVRNDNSTIDKELKVEMQIKEDIPQELLDLDIKGSNVYIIDDETDKDENVKSEYTFEEEDELEKITSDIDDGIEGKAKQLEEADKEDENDIRIIGDNPPTFEDLINLEDRLKFIDEEIDFIDNSFILKDYDKYSKTDEDYSISEDNKKRITSRKEVLGLAQEEIELIEEKTFETDYNKSLIDKIVNITEPGLDQSSIDYLTLKKCDYILPESDSLSKDEKISIEDDLIAPSALIIEEDIKIIKKRLEDMMKKKIEETIQDITNEITIIEEESNLKDAFKKMPKEKQEDIKMLLKYLNELFEKLPEETIKDFANSEYYDLYLKVLKDLDI